MKLTHKRPVAERRRQRYPPITDQIDAIMKMAAALREAGFCMPPETTKWIDDCLAVKREIPKTSAPEPAQAGFLTPGADMPLTKIAQGRRPREDS